MQEGRLDPTDLPPAEIAAAVQRHIKRIADQAFWDAVEATLRGDGPEGASGLAPAQQVNLSFLLFFEPVGRSSIVAMRQKRIKGPYFAGLINDELPCCVILLGEHASASSFATLRSSNQGHRAFIDLTGIGRQTGGWMASAQMRSGISFQMGIKTQLQHASCTSSSCQVCLVSSSRGRWHGSLFSQHKTVKDLLQFALTIDRLDKCRPYARVHAFGKSWTLPSGLRAWSTGGTYTVQICHRHKFAKHTFSTDHRNWIITALLC